MTKRLYPLLAAVLALSTLPGCFIFRRKSVVKQPKETPYISNEVEQQFEQRWKEKRVADLVGQGVDPQKAQGQADAEFAQQYGFALPKPGK